MKKIIMIGLILLTIFLSSGSALAWHRGNFGIFVTPPPFWVGPPAFYNPGYYPPPSYYGPHYYYAPSRVWIPGYWENRRTPSGWVRAWIPGYWEYRR
jgi:hypothetical protein